MQGCCPRCCWLDVCYCNLLQTNRCLYHYRYLLHTFYFSLYPIVSHTWAKLLPHPHPPTHPPSIWREVLSVAKSSLFLIAEGACGYSDLHRTSYGKYSAGLSSMLFSRGSTCGGSFEVRCVDHILWCLNGSPSIILTATDFCPPNYGLPADYGGWCNFPRAHFELSLAAFAEIAETRADIVPIQYRR